MIFDERRLTGSGNICCMRICEGQPEFKSPEEARIHYETHHSSIMMGLNIHWIGSNKVKYINGKRMICYRDDEIDWTDPNQAERLAQIDNPGPQILCVYVHRDGSRCPLNAITNQVPFVCATHDLTSSLEKISQFLIPCAPESKVMIGDHGGVIVIQTCNAYIPTTVCDDYVATDTVNYSAADKAKIETYYGVAFMPSMKISHKVGVGRHIRLAAPGQPFNTIQFMKKIEDIWKILSIPLRDLYPGEEQTVGVIKMRTQFFPSNIWPGHSPYPPNTGLVPLAELDRETIVPPNLTYPIVSMIHTMPCISAREGAYYPSYLLTDQALYNPLNDLIASGVHVPAVNSNVFDSNLYVTLDRSNSHSSSSATISCPMILIISLLYLKLITHHLLMIWTCMILI
jgi:hypothetical protein